MQSEVTTIQVNKRILHLLKKSKEYERQTYAELIEKMASLFNKAKKTSQYDEFLFKVQQTKMKDLWDNQYDEAWENV